MHRLNRIVATALFISALGLAGPVSPARGCTCFSIRHGDDVLVGRNYDWDFSDGLVLVNKRGLEKRVNSDPEAGDSSTWTARFGSVTFNQYGRDLPTGGMNEEGLVIEVLWLDGTVFPPDDARLALDPVQWIQYELDTAATVDDVIASLAKVRVAGRIAVHFFVADAGGAAASVEYLEGKEAVHRSADDPVSADRPVSADGAAAAKPPKRTIPSEPMPVRVLTNHTYQESKAYLDTRDGWSGREPIPPDSPGSLARFARAASRLRTMDAMNRLLDPSDIFSVLDDVANQSTQWTIAYDLKNRRILFRTRRAHDIKSIDLSVLDFSCRTPVRMIDVDLRLKGDVTSHWTDYTREANRDLIRRSYKKTEFLRQVPPAALDQVARYPESARCAD
jgi:penicillin V acylase-like amidase (Ntn superfamily)